MVQSKALTVGQYLAELPEDRRRVIAAVRKVVRANLPKGYREVMNWGMITWEVPLSRYPDTYNGKPLAYAALAAQKNHSALYLNMLYADSAEEARFRERFLKAGKKLDMGKCCVRFRAVEDLDLDAVADAVAATPVEAFLARYEASRKR